MSAALGRWEVGHVLEDGIQNLLLDLSNGVAAEDLHWDLGTIGVVGIDTAQDLWSGERRCVGEGSSGGPRDRQQQPEVLSWKGSYLMWLDW